MTHPHPNRRFVPQAVLTRVKDTTARYRAIVSENKGKGANAVKASHTGVTTAQLQLLSNYNCWKVNAVQDEIKDISKKRKDWRTRILMKIKLVVNGVAKRRNRTLIEAARTMLVDSKLSTTFWAEAVNTACYVLNRVLVNKPHTKTSYELIYGRTPLIDFMKPFSKAMRVFNKRTRIVEETLNIRFLENALNVTGNGPDWLFDVDSLTISMNYVPVIAGNQTNGIAGKRDNIIAGQANKKIKPKQEYILIPFCTTDPLISQGPKDSKEDVGIKPTKTNNTNSFNIVGTPVSAAGPTFTNDDSSSPVNAAEASNAFEDHLFERFSPFKNVFALPHIPNVFSTNDTRIFGNAYDDEDVGEEADINNLETTMNVSPIPTTRIDKDHPKDQIIGDLNSAIQTRRMTKISDEHVMVSYINKQRRTNHKDYQNCLFAYFLSQKEPKKVIQALADPSWIEAMQEELLIEAIKLFLAYASFMGFIEYQMDVKSAFLYGTIEEE
ncbi:putative ribonuclease H-like domain-containing protein, partial [Tanacetum coccineum]